MAVIIILGVVAALTIPVAIQNNQRSFIETRFKIFYSLMSRALEMSEAENGNVNDWVFHCSGCEQLNANTARTFAETYVTPYLKIMYVCDTDNNSKNRCFAGTNDAWHDAQGNR
ncbi:hypothetical protein IJS77_02295, partial [bacterium]|nr:hypothetical protein [bacterium]